MKTFGAALVRNVLLAVLIAVPVTLVAYAITWEVSGEASDGGVGGKLLDLTVLYPGIALLAALGAIPFTAAVWAVQRSRGHASRLVVAALSPLIMLPWLLMPARGLLRWAPFGISALIGLGVFAVLAGRYTGGGRRGGAAAGARPI